MAEVPASAAHPGPGEDVLRFGVPGPVVHPPGIVLGVSLPLLLLGGRQRRANPYAPGGRPAVEAYPPLLGLCAQEPQERARRRVEVDAADELSLAGSKPAIDGERQSVGERVEPAVVTVEFGNTQRFDRGLDMWERNVQGDPARPVPTR